MKDLLYKVNRRDNIAYGAIKVCECAHVFEIEEGDTEEDFFNNMFDDQTALDIYTKTYDSIKVQIDAFMADTPILSSTMVFYYSHSDPQGIYYTTMYDGNSLMELFFHKNSSGFVEYNMWIIKDEEEGN